MLVLCSFIVVLYGLCIGSFLNVVIFRYNSGEGIVKGSSHCQSCGEPIKWYDNIPLFSYIVLKGKCRNCKSKISIQYPLVESLNAVLWLLIFLKYQFSYKTLIYFALSSALIALSFIDEKLFIIPDEINIFILVLGVLSVLLDYNNWYNYIIGSLVISLFLLLVYLITKGNGMGFGDVKLMFVCGLVVGWKCIVSGFFIGCILAIVIHTIRMKISKKDHMLAFGPYLSCGIYISLFIGEILINSYLSFLSIL